MTNPPTPPTEVPPMPEADGEKHYEDCSVREWFLDENGTTTIEQWGEQGWAKAAEAEAEVERLRELVRKQAQIVKQTRRDLKNPECFPSMSCSYRDSADIVLHRVIKRMKTLTPKETTDD